MNKTRKTVLTLVALIACCTAAVPIALACADNSGSTAAASASASTGATATPGKPGSKPSPTATSADSGSKSASAATGGNSGSKPDQAATAGKLGSKPDQTATAGKPSMRPDCPGTGGKPGSKPDHAAADGKPGSSPNDAASAGKPGSRPDHAASAGTPISETTQNGYTITISGGYDTEPQDKGRPVVLIAAALGVPTETFRQAFSGVKPAGPDSSGPTEEEARTNKAALMKVLEPYGITNERLDEVSNYYRYNGSKGEVWSRTPAKLAPIVKDGAVTGVTILGAGAGYSSVPTITITGPKGKISVKAVLAYGTDFKKNGSIASATIIK